MPRLISMEYALIRFFCRVQIKELNSVKTEGSSYNKVPPCDAPIKTPIIALELSYEFNKLQCTLLGVLYELNTIYDMRT